jgi:pilus assembly protein CpaB
MEFPSTTVVLGVLLICLALGGGLIWADSVNQGRDVIVAARDLPIGAALAPGDLLVARVRIDDSLYAAAIPAAAAPSLVGKSLSEPAHAHQMLVHAQVADAPLLGPDQTAMTIAIKAEAAAGGWLKPGDAVRVLATADKDKPTARTQVIIERATVYRVGRDQRTRVISSSGSSGGQVTGEDDTQSSTAGDMTSLTLILTPEQALALAQVKWNGDLDVILLSPASIAPKGP